MSIIAAAEEAVHHVELPMPSVMYGVVALVIFVALGLVTWSFRDVANRHSHKFAKAEGHGASHDEHTGH